MMAAVAPAPFERRKKQALYGKSQRTTYGKGNAAFFEDDEEDELAVPVAKKMKTSTAVAAPRLARSHTTPTDPKPQAQPTRIASPVVVVSRTKKKVDTFDVPSSDDDDTMVVVEATSLPRKKIKSHSITEPVEATEPLAPWERRALPRSATHTGMGHSRTDVRTSGKAVERPQIPARKYTTEAMDKRSLARSSNTDEGPTRTSPQTMARTVGLSAKERLAARHQHNKATPAPVKKGDLAANLSIPPTHSVASMGVQADSLSKRRRVTPTTQTAVTHTRPSPQQMASPEEASIFDFPSDNGAEQPSKHSSAPSSTSTSSKLRPRLPARSSRVPAPQKAVSAPMHLNRMLQPENESRILTEASPTSNVSSDGSPMNISLEHRKSPATPKATRSASAIAYNQHSGSLTPKQAKLWDDFFDTATIPSIEAKKLSISREQSAVEAPVVKSRSLPRSKSDLTVKRTRMVDRLKAAIVDSSEAEDGDDSEDDEEDSTDEVLHDLALGATSSTHKTQGPAASQSQDRKIEVSMRKTYAKQRSHLTEENVDHAMMLDLPLETPERPVATARRVGRQGVVAKKSAFDMDHSDEAPAGGLRSIHELRAAGRTNRVMGEIEDLLGEVADHAASSKSRRRGALMEIATKLSDKVFAEQYTGHGFENKLLAECDATSDPAADFLLAAALAVMLGSKVPTQTTQACTAALPWLVAQLAHSTDVARMARDRRNNMSKAAQEDLVAFADKLKTIDVLWGKVQPTTMTLRLLALKGVELTVSKLRALGDRSELLSSDDMRAILAATGLTGDFSKNTSHALQASLAISIFESLSTLSAMSSWPSEVIAAIATLPAVFAKNWQAPQHTKWLAYRLCLNITNEHGVDASLFTDSDAMRHLLHEVVSGFGKLHQVDSNTDNNSEELRALRLDLLLLAIGILINLPNTAPQRATKPSHQPRSHP